MSMPDGLTRPRRTQDTELEKARAKEDAARKQAQQAREAAAAARAEAEALQLEAQAIEQDAERQTRDAELAARDRALAAQANEMVAGTHRGPSKRAPAKKSGTPQWVLAAKPSSKGIRRFLWLIWSSLQLYKLRWIPEPRNHGTHFGRVIDMTKELMDLRATSQAIIVVVTTKGGACKTTTSTWLAAIIAALIKLVTIVFDTDRGGGKVLKRFGLDSTNALASDDIVAHNGTFSYEELTRRAATDPLTGVITIHSKPVEPEEEFKDDTLGMAVYNQHTASHTTVVDCGPGFNVPNTTSALKCADVIVITADFSSGDDLDDVRATLDYPTYKLRDRDIIGRVVVAISAVKWRHFNTRTQYELANRFGISPDQVVLIPYSRYFLKTGRVNLARLRPKQSYAWTQLYLRCAKVLERQGRRVLPMSWTNNLKGGEQMDSTVLKIITNTSSSAEPTHADRVGASSTGHA